MPKNKLEITQEMTDIVVSMYKNGDKLSDIEKAIGHSDAIVYQILKDNNIRLNRKEIKLSDDQITEIIQLYKDGYNYQEIAEKIKICSRSKVYKVLKDAGVTNSFSSEKILSIIDEHNKRQGNRKYYFDEHIFDEINTPDKAYCIGLFMADGCNNLKQGKFSLELQERDKSVLEKIQIMFQSDYPLYFRDKNKTKNMAQNTYAINYHSVYFCKRLNELGIIPRKSLILEFPKWMPNILIPYLIKGYICGDGWVQRNNIGFMSTLNFCQGVQEYLYSIGIESHIMDMKQHYNENTKTLYITGRNNIIPLTEIMFSHGNLYIERKYQKYIEYGFLNKLNNSL